MLVVLHLVLGIPVTDLSPPCYCPQVELSDGTSHTITDAYAGKEYIIQVAAKDNDIGTWSDWSVAVHATPWTEEPKHLTTEAQITGEISLSVQTDCGHSGRNPGALSESLSCPAPCRFCPQPRKLPQPPRGCSPSAYTSPPTHGPDSRCNYGLRGADSAHLAPASSSLGV